MIRLTAILLTATLMQVSAHTFGQRISLDLKNKSLPDVVKEIRQQSGYDFLFGANLTNSVKPITVSVRNATIEQTLALCFDNQPVSYKIENKTVLLKLKSPEPLTTAFSIQKDNDVRGVVYNSKQEPLPGASIVIKGRNIGAVTNNRGEFILKNVPDESVLIVSFMGYIDKETVIGNRVLKIVLTESNSKLDEIQVMAYGKTSRRYSTGNITTVTAEELEQQPVQNPLLALIGKVPGMIVSPNTGYASGSVKVEIRGRAAVSSQFPSEPLYVIDGIPFTFLSIHDQANYASGSLGVIQNGAITPGLGQSPLFNINSADIQSIEVLKDADATAIFGSRGANGVIMITTKRGQTGPTRFTVDVSQGISNAMRYWNLLNTKDYVKMRKEAFKNDGIEPNIVNAPDLMVWDTTRYTNWQKELWSGTGKTSSVKLNISGGDGNTQFRISPNYDRSTDIMNVHGSNQRAGLGIAVDNSAFNKRLKTSVNLLYSYSNVNTTMMMGATNLPPNAPPIFDENGNINYKEWNDAGLGNSNPFSALKATSYSKTKMLVSKMDISYELSNGLRLSTLFGYNTSNNTMGGTSPISGQNPIDNPSGSLNVGTNENQNWSIEPQLNYIRPLASGTLSVFLGGTYNGSIANGQNIFGMGYDDDNLLGSIDLAPVKMMFHHFGEYRYAAVSARINFKTKKYIVNLSGRRDGSSRFGPGKRFGNFGALGLAWIASEEEWIKTILPSYVGTVKFRGSFGITGSDAVQDYKYLSIWSSKKNNIPLYPYGGATPLVPQFAINPNFQWQENKKLEFATELSFLEERLALQIAYYRDRIGNQLTAYPTPMFTGFNDVTANWPATLQNTGWEFSLNIKVIRNKPFQWTLDIIGSRNKNILLKYPDLDISPYASKYKIGRSVNDLYLLHYIGIDPMTGQYAFEDYNKNGFIDSSVKLGSDDRYINLNLDPQFSGAMTHVLQYKGLSFTFTFCYEKKYGTDAFLAGGGGRAGTMNNIPYELYNNRWQKPGDQAIYARLTTNTTDASQVGESDIYYTDASFLRLQNVALYYSIPKKITKDKQLSIHFNAQNLFLISKYKGIDPTIQSYTSMPTPRIVTAGLSFTF